LVETYTLQIYHGNILLKENKLANGSLSGSKKAQIYANVQDYVWQPGSAWTRWGTLSAPSDQLAAIIIIWHLYSAYYRKKNIGATVKIKNKITIKPKNWAKIKKLA